jgi:serine/threonine protein kinase
MIGRTLGHYRILEKLGAGGMGEVYLAEDATLHRKVALKVLPPELAGNAIRLERFELEARTLAALDHPNIVTIYSVEDEAGVRFLTMAYVQGKTLAELIPRGGLPLATCLKLAVSLGDGLRAAHERGIVHRDLKPGNVMVDSTSRLRILDFGLAKQQAALVSQISSQLGTATMSPVMTREGSILGTYPYMSPEQAEGKPTDARSDIFSFGVVLYEMTAGERPFQGETPAALVSSILKDRPRPLVELRPELPAPLGDRRAVPGEGPRWALPIGRCPPSGPRRPRTPGDFRRGAAEATAATREADLSTRLDGTRTLGARGSTLPPCWRRGPGRSLDRRSGRLDVHAPRASRIGA